MLFSYDMYAFRESETKGIYKYSTRIAFLCIDSCPIHKRKARIEGRAEDQSPSAITRLWPY